jgi:hypothetical protein
VAFIIGEVVEIITPANYELARKNGEGDYIRRAFPPIMHRKNESNACHD